MKSLFEASTYTAVLERLDTLSPDSNPQWGKMNVAQMLHHCQKPFEIAVHEKDFGLKPNILIKLFFKKSLYNDSPFRKNLPTVKSFKIVDERDFNTEKKELKELVNAFYTLREKENWKPHPVFGSFTTEQWGKLQYKHLDHHLRQFGV